MFEKASRFKLRFTTPRGTLAAEDLWDLPLTVLDGVAVALNRQLNAGQESFVSAGSKDVETQLKFDIAKHVIDTRLAENAAARTAADRKAKKEQLLEILARKQNAELESKSPAEIEAMIAGL